MILIARKVIPLQFKGVVAVTSALVESVVKKGGGKMVASW